VSLANWRDLSIILLVFEAFVIGLVVLAIYLAVNVGAFQINRRIKNAGAIVRSYFRKAEQSTKVASDRIAAPFITAGAATARVKRWQNSLLSSFRKKNEV
jgi:hypothetical protein